MYTVCIFGTGSLGANTAINIARILGDTVNFVLVDYDRIEAVNLANQPWYDVNVGQRKASVLSAYLYRTSTCTSVCVTKKVTSGTSFVTEHQKILNDVDVYVDCFDNMQARRYTRTIARKTNKAILHAGFAENVYLSRWDNAFPLKGTVNRAPVCDRRDLSTLVTIGAGLTAHNIARYLRYSEKSGALLDINGAAISLTCS